jgi:hypothetical protein
MEHLRVIRQARASTSSISTFSAYLVPPLVGNLWVLCWHLKAEIVSICPLSYLDEWITLDDRDVAFHNIICFFIKVQFVGTDVGMDSSFIEVAFNHLQERRTFTRRRRELTRID